MRVPSRETTGCNVVFSVSRFVRVLSLETTRCNTVFSVSRFVRVPSLETTGCNTVLNVSSCMPQFHCKMKILHVTGLKPVLNWTNVCFANLVRGVQQT